jgi:1,2-dihydroxy-3-keto-5-methylthiopentene dioxygenase
MATVNIPELHRKIEGAEDVTAFLATQGIDYERAKPGRDVPAGAPANELLDAYKDKIDELKARGGYVTADVIDVFPDTPNLETMLNKFNSEHWHDEDEVRFIVEGRGLFHIHPKTGPVFAIEVEAGDLIRVPRGTHHWFDLCADRRIPRDQAVPGSVRLDAALHLERRGQELPARVLRPGVLSRPALGFRRVTLSERRPSGAARHRRHHDADRLRARSPVRVRPLPSSAVRRQPLERRAVRDVIRQLNHERAPEGWNPIADPDALLAVVRT